IKEIFMPYEIFELDRIHRRITPIIGAAMVLVFAALVPGRANDQVAGGDSEEIPFYKHTIDLGQSEAAEIADVNRDGRLDIISGENWFEQVAPGKDGPRWIKHHFR